MWIVRWYFKQLWWIVPITLLAIAYRMNQAPAPINPSQKSDRQNLAAGCRHLEPWLVHPGQYFVCRDEYALDLDPATKMARWVAYCSNQSSISGNSEQSRDWKPDPAFPKSVQLEPDDYQGIGSIGYDRGHQAPLASFRGMNWEVTNYTTNITPQAAALNRGAWVALEKYERSLIMKNGKACVITGPYYEPDSPVVQLPNADESHKVPSGYWKIIVFNNNIESFVYDQLTPSGVDFKLGRTCNDEVERFSGFLISDRVNDFSYCPK